MLTGHFQRVEKAVDLDAVLSEIEDVRLDEAARLMRMQSGS